MNYKLTNTIIVLSVATCLNSCEDIKKTVSQAIEKIDGVGTSEENLKVEQTNAAIQAIGFSLADELKCYETYTSWINDIEIGPTGEEPSIQGLPKLQYISMQFHHLDTVIQKKGFPSLSEKAVEYKASLESLNPVADEANRYYAQENYKDDAMQKGKELHKKLMPLFEDCISKRRSFEVLLQEVSQKQHADALEKDKKEGRVLSYNIKYTVHHLERYSIICSTTPTTEMNVDTLQGICDELDKCFPDLKEAANRVSGQDKTLVDLYIGEVEKCMAYAKKLTRAIKTKETPHHHEYMATSYLSAYQHLIHRYNALAGASSVMSK